ncbi:hypothetical protein TNCV_499231 [Trichonephila clavipes]|nr:hypothetical protein TNCV_499231 [Trichonephila clavipes]
MVHGPKPPSQKIRLTPESFEKCEALRYREGAKHLLAACGTVCFAMLFGASVELCSTPELIIVPCGIKSTSKTPRQSQNNVAIILCFDSVCLALTLTGEDVCRHSIDCCFESGVIWATHVSSPVPIQLNVSPLSSS